LATILAHKSSTLRPLFINGECEKLPTIFPLFINGKSEQCRPQKLISFKNILVIFWHISYQPFARYLSTINVKTTDAKT
jgi:hypothetical protein